EAVQQFLADHGLPASDASVIYQYGRSDLRNQIRSYMLGRLLKIGSTPEPALSTHEQAISQWMAYQLWQDEITMLKVAIADRNSWQADPCHWAPDPDIAAAYGLNYVGSNFCNTSDPFAQIFNIAPMVPSAEYFIAAAQKRVYGALLADTPNGTAVQLAAEVGIAEAAGIGAAVGAITGGVISGVLGVPAVGQAIFLTAAGSAILGGGGGIGALAIAGAGGVAAVFVLIGVLAVFEVFQNQQTLTELSTLDDFLNIVQAEEPTISYYTGVPFLVALSGVDPIDANTTYKLSAAFTAATLADFPSTAALPAHNSATDPSFYFPGTTTVSDTLQYVDPAGDTWSAKTWGGWFVQTCTSGCSAGTDSITPTLKIVDPAGVWWYASRTGSSFTLSKINPSAGDVTCPASAGTPANPDQCSSYFTKIVPFKSPNGNSSFGVSVPAAFTSSANAFFTQGVAGSFQITATGSPLPAINGSLPAHFSLANSILGTAQLNYDGSLSVAAGISSIPLTATSGPSTVPQTLNVTLNPAPPQFTSSSTATFTKGVPGSFTIQATGNPAPAITSGDPHFPPFDFSLVDNGNGTATLSGTVPLDAPYCSGSSCSVTGLINATVGGSLQTQQTLTINIGSETLPFLLPTSLVFNNGVPNQAQIAAQGSTLGAISNVCTTLPSWLTFTDNGNNTATLSGTPPAGAGNVGLHVIVSPPGLPPAFICKTDGSNYTLEVVNGPVITSPDHATFTVGTAQSFTATSNIAGVLSVTGTLPSGLGFNQGIGSLTLTGTPAAGTGGAYPLLLSLSSNGTAVNTQKFDLVVDEQSGFPKVQTATFSVNEANAFALSVSGYPQTPLLGMQGTQVTLAPGNGLPNGVNLVQTINSLGLGTGEWVLTGTPTTNGTYTFSLNASNGVGSQNTQTFTIKVAPATTPRMTPVITWPRPTAINYGTPLSAAQLNAIANIPGTFIYTPPDGTILPVGSQEELSVTFMPMDSVTYAAVTYTTAIDVNPVTVSSIPSSSTGCNGTYTGTFNGNIRLSSGQNCEFLSGGVNGNIQLTGGNLVLSNTTITGNVQVQQGGTYSIGPGTKIQGNLQVQNLPASAAQNQVCGTSVKGNLDFQNNGSAVQIGGPSCAANSIGGNLTVQNNTAATAAFGNSVSGNLQDQNNTAPTQIFGNTVGKNLLCQNNPSITGGGNTAKSKQGQCAAF
ncbi:MAG TPA: putative Ig domain-containing protein, partial [Bryobacteraceae bacterium]|nr:putative Ig domain-containing protein [Bryobacteraceae bacterium]